MGPAQLSPQRGDNLLVGVHIGELNHPMQVRAIESATKLSGERLGELPNDLLAIVSSRLREYVRLDAAPNLPVQPDELRIDHGCDALSRLTYQMSKITKESRGQVSHS